MPLIFISVIPKGDSLIRQSSSNKVVKDASEGPYLRCCRKLTIVFFFSSLSASSLATCYPRLFACLQGRLPCVLLHPELDIHRTGCKRNLGDY